MAYAIKVKPDPIRSIAFGSVTGTYAKVGTPLDHPCRLVKFSNATNVAVFVSWNGTDDQMYLGSNSFTLLDISTNRIRDDGFFIEKGTQFYVKSVGSDPGSGSVYIEVYVGY